MQEKLRGRILVYALLIMASPIYGAVPDSLKKDSGSRWSFHFQLTVIDQYHGKFHSQYMGQNSLQDTAEQCLSLTSTLFFGFRLWKYGAFYFNPEISGGQGFSHTTGIAGFTNGEIYRVGNPIPIPYIARVFFQQSFALNGSHDTLLYDDKNQVNQYLPGKRITVSLGKFSLGDFMDNNGCSHDPRTQFMNWVLMDNGAWDYPANTRGYTYGAIVQLIKPRWFFSVADAMEPRTANGSDMDPNVFKAFGLSMEAGYNYKVKNGRGAFSLLLFMNQTRAPYYEDAIAAYKQGNIEALNIDNSVVYNGNKKYGAGLNFNYPISKYMAFFARAGWNDGLTGDWAFTEVDRTVTPGLSLDGAMWKRKSDNFGIAYVVNGLSKQHRDFENAGGYQFIIGDGKLANYAFEQILEIYYQCRFFQHLFVAADYQLVQNPGYNADRGPVSVGSVRVHVEF